MASLPPVQGRKLRPPIYKTHLEAIFFQKNYKGDKLTLLECKLGFELDMKDILEILKIGKN